jgi:hypothetical protein
MSNAASLGRLRVVLVVKMLLTAFAWVVPLLMFPTTLLEALGFPEPEPVIFLRLLGVAYAALLVGYWRGWRRACAGEYPVDTVWVGIVSNGGATLLLSISAALGSWSEWGAFASLYMWLSLVGVALVTTGLIVEGPLRHRR